MGTRGAIGFVKGENFKVTYNHLDSYPSGLGCEVVEYIKSKSIDEIHKDFDKITLVKEGAKPTADQIKQLEKFTDLNVSHQSTDDWYCLLREAQGDLNAYAEAGYMIDSHTFLYDSVWCEWAYLINLDENILEVYKGFQGEPPKGRFKDVKPDGDYYAVSLIATKPLDQVSIDWMKELDE